jgi:alanine racemase
MVEIHYPSHIEVDLIQYKKNISSIKKYINNKKICLSVKANGYGHGIREIALAAAEARADYLAIARVDEGVKIREKKVDLPILLMSPFFKEDIPFLVHFNIEPTISSQKQLFDLKSYLQKNNKKLRSHIKIDTGMTRGGVLYDEAKELINSVTECKNIELISLYSHFVSGEKKESGLCEQQAKLFEALFLPLKKKYPSLLGHICNSGGLINFPTYHYDMVRPGLISYGYIPPGISEKELLNISSCFSVKSKVGLVHKVEKGQGISYDHTYFTNKRTKIAVILIGYGDGYPFCLSNQAQVLIRGKRFQIVGRICMDLMMVDIGNEDIETGEEVVLIGRQGSEEIKVTELASKIKTIIYEIICGFTSRLPVGYKN